MYKRSSSHCLPCGCPRLRPDFKVPLNEPHSPIKAQPPQGIPTAATVVGMLVDLEVLNETGEGKQAHTAVRLLYCNSEDVK